VKLFSARKTVLKILVGGFVVLVFLGTGVVFSKVAGAQESAARAGRIDAACANMRRLSRKPLATCEKELESEASFLGKLGPKKFQCLAEMKTLDDYPPCKDFEYLKTHSPAR